MTEEIVVVDNGTIFESEESSATAQEAAARAKQWAEESERQAGYASTSAATAVNAKDDAVAAKEYAETAITDPNLIAVATDLTSTPSNIKTVATNINNINNVAGDLANIDAVANDLTNINNASTHATNAEKWAEGTDEEVASLGGTHSAKGWAEVALSNIIIKSTDRYENKAEKCNFVLGDFDEQGEEIASTAKGRSDVVNLKTGDEIRIINFTGMNNVELYDKNGIKLDTYTALTGNNNGLWIKEDVSARIVVAFNNTTTAQNFIDNPNSYLAYWERNIVNIGDTLTFEKRTYNGTRTYNHSNRIISREFVRFKKGDVYTFLPHKIAQVRGYDLQGNNITFEWSTGSGTNISNRAPFTFKKNTIMRLNFWFDSADDCDNSYSTITNDIALYHYEDMPAGLQVEQLTEAASINKSTDLMAHSVSACHYKNGICYAVYYADETQNKENRTITSIKIMMAKFNIAHKNEVDYKIVCKAGDKFGNYTLSNDYAPYDPQIYKISDTELRIYMYAVLSGTTSSVVYLTYNPVTDTIADNLTPVKITYNNITYLLDQDGLTNLFTDSGFSISAGYMAFSCNPIIVNNEYYAIFTANTSKAILAKSTDLENWDVVSFFDSTYSNKIGEATLTYDNNVFYAICRSDSGSIFFTYDGNSWTSDLITTQGAKPLFIESFDGSKYGIINNNSSRIGFHIMKLENGKLNLLYTAFHPATAHYFDYFIINNVVYLLYSSDIKASSETNRATIQIKSILAGFYPY